MISDKRTEHFVTLFDSKFLPMGMALHASMMERANPFHLWIVCMDDLIESQLKKLALPDVSLIPLHEVEDERLLRVKPGRSRLEYCWTLTCFSFDAVFIRAPELDRLTYVDADLFFFDDPQILFKEFEQSGKHVLITEHAFDPHNDMTEICGRFCVQFLTFRNTHEAKKVRTWWQERCLEWCFATKENGKFGDQKYLDVWPELFPNEVYIVKQREKMLAPWNVYYFEKKNNGVLAPVFYHFHGLRIISSKMLLLYGFYRIGRSGKTLYDGYFEVIDKCVNIMHHNGMKIPCLPLPVNKNILKRILRSLVGIIKEKRRKFTSQ
jgi:hypothetical protein